ncbi:hypothetical protein SERLA73DRAFT_123570 [Serpula lacrymans var. lacrymans S7.3]|uniref:Fungal-type protein kinase domain-containing protein n=1 Tax=Serpula lacrymans var. lacrymans (strain S7.3) TaxID=936435 RepID=F8Q1N3_SERL3|nr:hypothetical protein SERLA73DRAFT_123570 [Serpula lacrymans var. lacrymans S7.3]
MDKDVSGGVYRPFWEGFPYCDIHLCNTPDVLHQLYQGVIKHIILWCQDLMGTEKLDARICTLPPAYGSKHFKNGLSPFSQISGGERKDMAKVLLGCLVGKLPKQAIITIRSLLDFIYIAHIFVTLGVRENFNIPKFHSLLHYVNSICWFGATNNYNAEMFERFHIDMAKDVWRASNHRNERPQMTTWLTRQEKTAWFECYQLSLQNRPVLLSNSLQFTLEIVKPLSPIPS